MFTGIIEELGTIETIETKGNTMVLSIRGKKVLEDVKLGDSIAVNGVCLTVTSFTSQTFQVDVMPETFRVTSLASVKQGSFVNLERSVPANGRFGGHFVTGHVDTTGKIVSITPKENAIEIDITFPEEYAHFLLMKGSIALDGTSLTIFGVTDNKVTVSIIPHTAEYSVIGVKDVGDIVNIEFDMIGKYLYSFFQKQELTQGNKSSISAAFLKENGFM